MVVALVTVPQEVRLARHAGDLDDDGHDTHGVTNGTAGGFTVTPPLTNAMPPWVGPSGSGAMTDHPEGRITDLATTNVYSIGLVFLEGVLHHFYTKGSTEHSSDSAVFHRQSYDLGVTWTTGVSIFAATSGRHGNVEGALVTSRGRIILSLDAQNNSDAFDVICKVIYSDDNGRTWSDPYTVPNTFSGDCVGGSLIEIPTTNEIWMFIYGEQTGVVGGNTFVKVVRSTDGGATFGDETTVASSASRTYQEPRAAVVDGQVVVLMRSDTNVHTWRTTASPDDITTWSTPADVVSISGPPDFVEFYPRALLLIGRNDNTVWRPRSAVSWDAGETWTSVVEVDAGETRELDGTALCVLAPGYVIGVYALLTSSGSSTFYIRRWYDGYGTDHLGNVSALSVTPSGTPTFGTPAIVLGTSAAAGSVDEVIRRDSTIVAFDATAPATQAFGDAAATGSAAVAARRDHVHGMPATPATGGAADHAHVAGETHLSDGSTTTWTLDQAYEPGSIIAWNTTTIARLTVTEVPPDQATVSAAGTTGDSIVFDYAATVA